MDKQQPPPLPRNILPRPASTKDVKLHKEEQKTYLRNPTAVWWCVLEWGGSCSNTFVIQWRRRRTPFCQSNSLARQWRGRGYRLAAGVEQCPDYDVEGVYFRPETLADDIGGLV